MFHGSPCQILSDDLVQFSESDNPSSETFTRLHRHLQTGCAFCAGMLNALNVCDEGEFHDAETEPTQRSWIFPRMWGSDLPGSEDEVLEGIESAIHMGADVIHVSHDLVSGSDAVVEMLEQAESQGITVVISDEEQPVVPAQEPSVFQKWRRQLGRFHPENRLPRCG